jgi:hypothetical protein
MAKVDIQLLKKSLKINEAQLSNLAYGAALSKFKAVKEETLEEFDDHPVTKELKGGPAAENLSQSLPDGNLFSFIGFPAETDPTEPVRRALEEKLSLTKKFTVAKKGNLYSYFFVVQEPTFKDLEQVSPMPEWTTGSWLRKLEDGISGLQHYIFGVFRRSRSGTGLQVKGRVKSGRFRGIKYISEILQNFRRKF